MATLPASPPTLPSASAICPEGTATTTTSASVASPPSRPTAVTAWPARSQRRASPPPTLPLPSTKMFTLPPRRDLRRGGPGRPERHRDLADSLVRSAGLVHFRPPSTPRELLEEVRRTEVPERGGGAARRGRSLNSAAWDPGTRKCADARYGLSCRFVLRSEERRVGKECRSRWSP